MLVFSYFLHTEEEQNSSFDVSILNLGAKKPRNQHFKKNMCSLSFKIGLNRMTNIFRDSYICLIETLLNSARFEDKNILQ